LRFLRYAFDLFLFSSLYIALCAVVMTVSVYGLFHLAINRDLVLFIFSGTLCSYNFHWLLTPGLLSGKHKSNWSYRHRYLHLFIFIASLISAAWFAFTLIDQWHWLLLTAFVTFLYSAPKIPLKPFSDLKQVAVAKTVFLAFAWTHIPFILPLMVAGIKWGLPEYTFIFNRFYLIYAICILFDYRDREQDKTEGIRSMVTQLTEDGVNRLFIATMVVFFGSTAVLWFAGLSFFDTVLQGLPGLILAVLYRQAKKQRSDYYYYFLLDGLMMLSGLLWLLFHSLKN
jgi:4-hydroxybenzoate polyprenyltransferase